MSEPRRFSMVRQADQSGVSGTGKVLDGVEFSNGKVAVSWRPIAGAGGQSSVGVYDSFAVFEAIHITSHPDNGTQVIWHDQP